MDREDRLMPVPDPPSEHGGEPAFSSSDQTSIDSMKPGVFSPRRLPDLYREDFANGLNVICYSGTATITTGVASHPGILRMVTGAVANDECRVCWHDAIEEAVMGTGYRMASSDHQAH